MTRLEEIPPLASQGMMFMEGITFVGIPFYSQAKYQGMGKAVESLRNAGIVQSLRTTHLSVSDIGDVECPPIPQDKGPRNLKNFEAFLEGTRRVKEKLSREAKKSSITFCLGGECTFIVGSIAALKTVYKGKPGLLWLDAHGDYNTPETTPSGFIGGMPLAMACGLGPKLSSDIENLRPLLEPERVVHVGSRALDPGEEEALRGSVTVYDAKTVKQQGAKQTARSAAKLLAESSDWIIAHLDVDVLDPSVIPGVNFPEPGGLSQNEVLDIFRGLQSTGKLRVVDLTAYNPARDVNSQARSVLLDLAPKLVAT